MIKKIFMFFLILTLCLGVLVGCKKAEEPTEELLDEIELEDVVEEEIVEVEPIEVEVEKIDVSKRVSKEFINFLNPINKEGFLYLSKSNSEKPILILNAIDEDVSVEKALLDEKTKELEVVFSGKELEEDEVKEHNFDVFELDIDSERVDLVKVIYNDNKLYETIFDVFRSEDVLEGTYVGLIDNNSFELSVTEDEFYALDILEFQDEFEGLNIKENSIIRVFYNKNEHEQLKVKEIVILEEPVNEPILVEYMGLKEGAIEVKIGEDIELIYINDLIDEFNALKLKDGELISIKYEEMLIEVKEPVGEAEEVVEEDDDEEVLGEEIETLTPQKVLTFIERFDLTKISQETKGMPSELVIEILEDTSLLSEKSSKLINLLSKKKGYYIFDDYEREGEYVLLISLGKQDTDVYDLEIEDALITGEEIYVLVSEIKSEEDEATTALTVPYILARFKNIELDMTNPKIVHIRNADGDVYHPIKLNTAL